MRTMRVSALTVLTLCVCHALALGAWEEAWRVGDAWTYRVKSVEISMFPFHADFTLAIAVVGGAWRELSPAMTAWAWALQIEHEKHSVPVSAEASLYLVKGFQTIHWPLPTLHLWHEAFRQMEGAAAQLGVHWDGTGPAVWERRSPVESDGVPKGELVHRIVIEPIGIGTVKVAGSPVEATQFRYLAESWVELVGERARRLRRAHTGTAWANDEVRNWLVIEGRAVEGFNSIVREYRLELVSFSPGAGEGVGPSRP